MALSRVPDIDNCQIDAACLPTARYLSPCEADMWEIYMYLLGTDSRVGRYVHVDEGGK